MNVQNVRELVNEIFKDDEIIIDGAISNPKNKKQAEYDKIKVAPISMKGEILYQFSGYKNNQVFHNNLSKYAAIEKIINLGDCYKQIQLYGVKNNYQLLISKSGSAKLMKSKPSKKLDKAKLKHNREKNYIINEGNKCDFLIYLGVMNETGKILADKYDKFRQINKFLEFVSDTTKHLNKDRKLNIIDFGCGKSYLTFALYYYLKKVLNLDISIYGLDLKEEVIDYCNKIATELGYEGLKFYVGDIKNFEEIETVDMVVTLHACDNATDEAIAKAYKWGAKIIMSVPCCQHEFFNKIDNPIMKPMLKNGIIKERLSALITDSVRVNILQILGYETQIIEFIDMEHTPKNLMIRAINTGKEFENIEYISEYKEFIRFWNVEPYIEGLLGGKFKNAIKASPKK